MNIKNKKLLVLSLVCSFLIIFTGNVFPINIDNLIAYPVPFNPKLHKTLRIDEKPGKEAGPVDKVKIEIYDINGDTVFKREYSAIPILWNGRNNNSRIVKPGLYIIKISLEDTATGEFKQKTIRILING